MRDPPSQKTEGQQAIEFGRFEWHAAQRRLLVDGRPATLARRAVDVLAALMERRDRVVSKAELLDLVWPDAVVEEGNLYVHVSALRKLLGPEQLRKLLGPEHITTVPGRGYRVTLPPAADPVPLSSPWASPSRDSLRLPPMPPIVGREAELELLLALTMRHRLVSLVGPAGVGKTRLALGLIEHLDAGRGDARRNAMWPDGARLVEVSHAIDASQLTVALASATGVEGGPLLQTVRRLQGRRMLVVLDGCEAVRAAAASLVEALLQAAPGVSVLATSQQALRTGDERMLRLQPLPVPDRGAVPNHASASMRLFMERIQALQPGFTLAPTDTQTAADICRQLDGLPLAIELAAARVPLLGLRGVHDRLDDRLRLLGGGRSRMPRHQTLRAAIDWTYQLLSDDESRTFRRLGPFVGGFSLALAQRVACDEGIDEWAALDLLGALVDKSLVMAQPGEPPRYRLLDSTRAFALECAVAAKDAVDARQRHARAMRGLLEESVEALDRDETNVYLAAVTPELDNVRAALEGAVSAADWPVAIALAGAAATAFSLAGQTLEIVLRLRALSRYVDASVAPPQADRFWRNLCVLGANARMPVAELMSSGRHGVEAARATGSRAALHRAFFLLAVCLSRAQRFVEVAGLLLQMHALGKVCKTPG